MDEHLVDDDLGEQQRQQGKELQEERSDQHLAQKLTVLDDCRDEPGEIELQVFETQVGPLGEEQELPTPGRFELLAREQERTRPNRILNESLLPFKLREHNIAPICLLRHGRKWCAMQFAPSSLVQAGLESEVLGGTEQIGIRKDLAGLRKLMAQLRSISRQIVEPGQNQE